MQVDQGTWTSEEMAFRAPHQMTCFLVFAGCSWQGIADMSRQAFAASDEHRPHLRHECSKALPIHHISAISLVWFAIQTLLPGALPAPALNRAQWVA